MSPIVFPAQIRVARHPHMGMALLFFALLIIVAFSVIYAVIKGRQSFIYLVLVLPLLYFAVKNASAPCEARQTMAKLSIVDDLLILELPGTRRYENGYADQRYEIQCSDIDEIAIDGRHVTIGAYHLSSVAMQNGQEASRKDLDHGSVSFDAIEDDAEEIIRYVLQKAPLVRLRSSR